MSRALNLPLIYFTRIAEEQNNISFYSAIALDLWNTFQMQLPTLKIWLVRITIQKVQ